MGTADGTFHTRLRSSRVAKLPLCGASPSEPQKAAFSAEKLIIRSRLVRRRSYIYTHIEIPKLCAPEARLTPEGDEEVVPPHLRSEDS
eukprot:scaffold66381_cov63-Phaeocystis_antarctica.AAC.7